MSLRNRYLALLPVLFLIAGCGLRPLYGKNPETGQDPAILGGITVEPIEGRMGQQLRADLEDRLNPGGRVPANPVYRLTATVSSSASPIGVARDGTVSRYNVYLNSDYVLYRNGDGEEMSSGTLNHVSSYNNTTGAYYSTYISEADAIKRGITELAELYRQRLAADFGVRKPKKQIKKMQSPYSPNVNDPYNRQANERENNRQNNRILP